MQRIGMHIALIPLYVLNMNNNLYYRKKVWKRLKMYFRIIYSNIHDKMLGSFIQIFINCFDNNFVDLFNNCYWTSRIIIKNTLLKYTIVDI